MSEGYNIRVPFRIGQTVYLARPIGGMGTRELLITPNWVVTGYKLDEDGTLWAMCYRVQGGVKRYEYIDPERLFLTEEEAKEAFEDGERAELRRREGGEI